MPKRRRQGLVILLATMFVTQPVVAGFRDNYQRSEIAHQRLVFATRLLVERQTALEEHARRR